MNKHTLMSAMALAMLCNPYLGGNRMLDIPTNHPPTTTPEYINELKQRAQEKRDRKANNKPNKTLALVA